MTLNKKKMVREIGRRTRLRNRDVQLVIETLVDVWTEELVSSGRIEIENFMVLDTKIVERSANGLLPKRRFRRIRVRISHSLHDRLNHCVLSRQK